jgi:phosphatidylinositol kinase/protein kinase (PI-3  family)
MSQFIIAKSSSVRDWWGKYTNYVKTHAQWSMVGYMVGLGDRHLDNILVTEHCKLVHIDFEYATDIGLTLPVPELVPFRMTNCMVEPLGCLGEFGLFYSEMIKVAHEIEGREANLWKALSNFADNSDNNLTLQIMARSTFRQNWNTPEDGIAAIIRTAINPELLRRMFRGWRSYL